jgi:GNAT superfamily N-acetyltransferase
MHSRVRDALKAFKDKYVAEDGNGYLELSYKQCRAFLKRYNGPGHHPDAVSLQGFTVIPEARGKGHGNRALSQICQWADKHKIELKLWVEQYDNGPLNNSQLVQFYRKFGFKGTQDGMTRIPG